MEKAPARLIKILEPRIPLLEVAVEGYIHQKNFLNGITTGKGKGAASNQPIPQSNQTAGKGRGSAGKGKRVHIAKGKGKGKGKGKAKGKAKGTPQSAASYAGSSARRPRPDAMSNGTGNDRNVRPRVQQAAPEAEPNRDNNLIGDFDSAWDNSY